MPHPTQTGFLHTNAPNRIIGVLGASAIVAALAFVLLVGLPVHEHRHEQTAVTLLDIPARLLQLPRPMRPADRSRHNRAPSQSSPRNLRNKATPVLAPPPVILPVVPSPVVAASNPSTGSASSNGASDHVGPGQGAGGAGAGTGSGGQGDGDGDGYTPPRQIKGRLRIGDLPPELRDGIGRTVMVRYDIDTTGRVTSCEITASSGNADLDAETCQLIQQRFRFRPERDPTGEPVPTTIEESHHWEYGQPPDTSGPTPDR